MFPEEPDANVGGIGPELSSSPPLHLCRFLAQVMDPSQPPSSSPHGTTSWVVVISRAAHGLVSALFLCSIAVVYVGAWRGNAGVVTLAALAALGGEGLLVVLSHGNCPLGPVFRRLGDEKPFFELLLPPRAAALAVPVFAAVTVLGAILLAVRTL